MICFYFLYKQNKYGIILWMNVPSYRYKSNAFTNLNCILIPVQLKLKQS